MEKNLWICKKEWFKFFAFFGVCLLPQLVVAEDVGLGLVNTKLEGLTGTVQTIVQSIATIFILIGASIVIYNLATGSQQSKGSMMSLGGGILVYGLIASGIFGGSKI